MNITCVICSELFINGADVYFTHCGHVFHYQCLINWLERSKSCPQCRNRVTEQSIHKVYFNISNAESAVDATTLMYKLDTLNFTLTLKNKEIKDITEKKTKLKEHNRALRAEIAKMETNQRNFESTLHAFKDQIAYFKTKAKESDRLSEEIMKLKNSIKNMENIEVAIHGTRDQVSEILRNEHNAESLALLAATLKKALLDSEKKVRDTDFNLKKVKNELNKLKKEHSLLEAKNSDIRRELQQLKLKNEKEKNILKKRLKSASHNNIVVANSEVDSPQLPSTSDVILVDESHKEENSTLSTSLSVVERIDNIMNSDSPYLPVKHNFGSFMETKFQSPTKKSTKNHSNNGKSIFKISQNSVIKMGTNSDVCYNGLGGTAKVDNFPTPKPQRGIKRIKSSSSIPSSKFKKLAPSAGAKSKLTDFINLEDTL